MNVPFGVENELQMSQNGKVLKLISKAKIKKYIQLENREKSNLLIIAPVHDRKKMHALISIQA